MTSGYTDKRDGGARRHGGMDFAVPIGTPVRAMAPGKVKTAGDTGEYPGAGIMVTVEHDVGGVKPISRYMHLSAVNVKPGDQIAAGDVVGFSGDTGANAPHLHADVLIDPAAKARWELYFGQPPGGWVMHSNGMAKVPLESLVPIDAHGDSVVPKPPPGRGLGWLLLIALLLWDN